MKIYHQAANGGAKTFLCSGLAAGEHPQFSQHGGVFGVIAQKLLDADFVKAMDHGNDSHPIVFAVERDHGSDEAAFDFYFQHTMAIRAVKLGTYVFAAELPGGREVYYYLKNAGIQSVLFREPQVGSSTTCTYTLIGGSIDRNP